jgi:hypothetical protein
VEVSYQPNLNIYYDEFPVAYNHMTMFMFPNTRVLQKIGTHISRTDILPPMYMIRGKWYSVTNRLVESKDPKELNPESDRCYVERWSIWV